MTKPEFLDEPADFSLVRGGPLFDCTGGHICPEMRLSWSAGV